MEMYHRIPFADNKCIVGKYQTCRFSEHPLKNPKSVFIAGPNRLRRLTDLVKDIVVECKLDPVMAVDMVEYNNSAFCAHICRPMLESLIVIVVGDWKENYGNVNVAFEHGIATSLGCEIVPVWVNSEKKDAFDISGLAAILIEEDWETNAQSVEEFREKFFKYFEGKKDAVMSRGQEPKVSEEERAQIRDLTERFSTTLDCDERRAIVSLLKRQAELSGDVLYDDTLVNWAIDTTITYSKSYSPGLESLIGRRKYDLDDNNFLELLRRVVDWSKNRLRSEIVTNSEFHSALSGLAVEGRVPMKVRKCTFECTMSLGSSIGDDEILRMISRIAQDARIGVEDFASLKLGQGLRLYVEYALTRGPLVTPVLEMIQGLRKSDDPVVRERGNLLLKAMSG